jgi:hypothetical protein
MCAGVFELEISVEAPLGATTTDSSSKGLIASGSWAGELESVCGVAVCQPTSAHQESWAALTAGSVFGPEGGTRSTGEFSGAKAWFTSNHRFEKLTCSLGCLGCRLAPLHCR